MIIKKIWNYKCFHVDTLLHCFLLECCASTEQIEQKGTGRDTYLPFCLSDRFLFKQYLFWRDSQAL